MGDMADYNLECISEMYESGNGSHNDDDDEHITDVYNSGPYRKRHSWSNGRENWKYTETTDQESRRDRRDLRPSDVKFLSGVESYFRVNRTITPKQRAVVVNIIGEDSTVKFEQDLEQNNLDILSFERD